MAKRLVIIWTTIIFCSLFKSSFSLDLPKKSKVKLTNPLIFLPRSTDSLNRKNYETIKLSKVISTNSTIIFQEDFKGNTGFPPNGWKIVDNDGGGITDAWFQGKTAVFTAYNGTGYAAANYQGANDFLIDQCLITPFLTGIDSTDTICFWYCSPDFPTLVDSIEVRILTYESPILIETQTYTSSPKSITIKPATGNSPTININATVTNPFGIAISGASKIIINGSNTLYEHKIFL